MTYELKCKLLESKPIVEKSEKFKVREFIVEHGDKYPQTQSFQLVNDKCDLIDSIPTGSEIVVYFNLRGRRFNDKVYNSLNAWKIESNNHKQEAQSDQEQDF